LTTLVIAALVAAAGIGLAIAGQRDDPKPNPVAVNAREDADDIHVQVVDGRGKRAPGVLVELLGRAIDPPRSFQTDGEGRVQISREATRDADMLFAQREDQSLAWTMVGNPSLHAAAGTEADPIVMKLLARTHRVTGSVVDREGKPIPGAEIVVESLGRPTNRSVFRLVDRSVAMYFPHVLTDQAGRFTLTLPEETDVGLSAQHFPYLGEGMARAEVQILEPMILKPAAGISGSVTDATTGLPVAGVLVGAQLIEHRKRILAGWSKAMTDHQGRFVIIGLEPGVYNLLFEAARGRAQATARAIEGLRVRTGALAPANLTVIEGRPLRGVVIDQETKRPMGGALVGCHGPARPNSGAAVLSRRTDERGRFTFHVPPGEQRVYIMDAGTFSRLSSQTVVVPDHGEIELVRLRRINSTSGPSRHVTKGEIRKKPQEEFFRPGQAVAVKVKPKTNPSAPEEILRTATGRVRDSEGRPVFGVRVMVDHHLLRAEGLESFDTAVTDREGTFILRGLPRRELRLNLNRPNSGFQREALPADRDAVEWTYRAT